MCARIGFYWCCLCLYSSFIPSSDLQCRTLFLCFRFIFILCLQGEYTTKQKYKCQQIVECACEMSKVCNVFVYTDSTLAIFICMNFDEKRHTHLVCGKTLAFFYLSRVLDVICWKSDSHSYMYATLVY